MQQLNSVVAFLIILLFTSCENKEVLSPSAYLDYFSSGKTASKVVSGDLVYEVRFVTPEFVALQDVANSKKDIDKQAVVKRLSSIKDNLYFFVKLPLSTNEVNNKKELLDYYNYKIKASIKLVTKSKFIGLMPEYIQYEDNYGLAATNTLIACFNKDSSIYNEGCKLYFDDMPNNNPALIISYSRVFFSHLPILSL